MQFRESAGSRHRTYRTGEAHWRPDAWSRPRFHRTDDTLLQTPALSHTPIQLHSPVSLLTLFTQIRALVLSLGRPTTSLSKPRLSLALPSAHPPPPCAPPPKKTDLWGFYGRGPRRCHHPSCVLCDSCQGRVSCPSMISSHVQLIIPIVAPCFVLVWRDILSPASNS